MMELVTILNTAGSDVVLVSFSNLDDEQKDLAVWEDDFIDAYQTAFSIAAEKSLPLFFLGYSLGALLGQYLASTQPRSIQFSRQVLFAPATAIRLPGLLKPAIKLLANNLKIPSYTPKGYRINNWLPAKVYKAMMNWEKGIKKTAFANLNIPTLVIIDPKDELVSYTTIRKQIKSYHLTNYKCIVLESSLKQRSTRYHHLMIDEATMGKKNWAEVTNQIRDFLDASTID